MSAEAGAPNAIHFVELAEVFEKPLRVSIRQKKMAIAMSATEDLHHPLALAFKIEL